MQFIETCCLGVGRSWHSVHGAFSRRGNAIVVSSAVSQRTVGRASRYRARPLWPWGGRKRRSKPIFGPEPWSACTIGTLGLSPAWPAHPNSSCLQISSSKVLAIDLCFAWCIRSICVHRGREKEDSATVGVAIVLSSYRQSFSSR
jgi:hypothetical protein